MNKYTKYFFLVLFCFSINGCVYLNFGTNNIGCNPESVFCGMSKYRESYIKARPHGYLDITIRDNNAYGYLKENESEFPPPCFLELGLNKEKILYEVLYLKGDGPPYTLDTGYILPVLAGVYSMDFMIHKCKQDGDVYTKPLEVEIKNNEVLYLYFDGENLSKDVSKQR